MLLLHFAHADLYDYSEQQKSTVALMNKHFSSFLSKTGNQKPREAHWLTYLCSACQGQTKSLQAGPTHNDKGAATPKLHSVRGGCFWLIFLNHWCFFWMTVFALSPYWYFLFTSGPHSFIRHQTLVSVSAYRKSILVAHVNNKLGREFPGVIWVP